MKTAADGDDYTWSDYAAKAVARMAPALGGAVFNGTASAGLEATQYSLVAVDLRTPDQKLKELASRVVELEKEVLTLRLTLERIFEIRL